MAQYEAASGPVTIALVAGEASGDNLGAALIEEILEQAPDTRFIGMGGPSMHKAGFASVTDIERLTVNGLIDPLLRLPDLIKLLLTLRDEIVDSGADCFVGIDSNFFNLLLAGMLRKRGIRTVQYVSPTVWAWRQGRVNKIRRNVDLVMTLYPFETEIYRSNNVSSVFVGHPKAKEISPDAGSLVNQNIARSALGLGESEKVVTIMPGSRASEVKLTGVDFLDAAALLSEEVDRFLIPAANERRYEQIKQMLQDYPRVEQKAVVLNGESRLALTAANVVLVNSGTATLEAMLLRKPMVMSYRLGKLTYAIISRMVKTDRFALPNILADEELVPEYIQHVSPLVLADQIRRQLSRDHTYMLGRFADIHQQLLAKEAQHSAASTVLDLANRK